jgi:CIC family chloride channel protein
VSEPEGSNPASEAAPSERSARPSTFASLFRRRAGRALIDGVTAGPDVRAALRATFHAVIVGATVGVVSTVFYLLLRAVEHFVLGTLVGHRVLLPAGEPEVLLSAPPWLSPWFMVLLPALGGLASGVLVHRYAPETGGGGGNAYVASFHSTGAGIRRRVAWLKILATAFTLGTGGSAGREGPTMQVGAAIGDRISRKLRLSRKDQRRLLVAGTAAGLTAMFGTPLGAALLATEVLYRDDFESEALVPAILASVTAFALVGTLLPEQRDLFAHAARCDVNLTNLALCLPLVALLFGGARLFVALLRTARRLFGRVRTVWLRPAIGGLALGVVGTSRSYS